MVSIDEELVPLMTQVWRLGFETKVSCQDVGEAVRDGGTRTAPADRPTVAARLRGRAWLVVKREHGPLLMTAVRLAGASEGWALHPVKQDTDPSTWLSITLPRTRIRQAAQALTSRPSPRP
ncbi:hypothetical protein [Actinomadura harenae]|uniref:Uncharacterized protein n=1 Tax=Actinomadura harenae TaxID=2483351 RepID=A0A3M2M858_9ACTN|nr:hypothetical protein [Actinomadura harenae]RMI43298.1 hypothetical protein EBO15_16585 [Actinomadura harenae]